MARYKQKDIECQTKWIDRINRAKKVRKSWKEKFRVELAKQYFEGQQNPGYPDSEWITVNKFYSTLKAKLPSLYRNDPYFYVKLKRSFSPDAQQIARYEQMGKTRQAMLNYYKSEAKLKEKVRLCILDAQFQYGVIKTHHSADLTENPDYGNPMYGENEEPLMDDSSGELLMEPETIPVNERYNWSRVHPDDFIFGEDSGTLEDTWSWVGQRIVMTMREALEDKRFDKKALKSVDNKSETVDEELKSREENKKGNDVAGRGDSSFDKYHKKTEQKKELIYWEVYDLKEKKWLCVAEGAEIPLVYPDKLPPGVEKHPYSYLIFTPRDDSPYPIPPMSQGIDSQKEYNTSRSRIMTHRKRFNRKYTVIEGQLADESEISKLETGEDGTVIRVQAHGAIEPIQDAPLDQQTYMELNFLNMDMTEQLGGVSDEARGIAGADSATQAGILEKRLDIREGDDVSLVIDFVRDSAKKMDQLIEANISKDEAVMVTGPEGEFWQMIRTDDYEKINGEYEYSVNVGSTMPNLPQVERSSWMAFLGVIGANPMLATSKRLLEKTAEMHHIEDRAMVEEIYNMATKAMQAQQQKQAGDMAGVSRTNPAGATAGVANGNLSLNQPGAGNL